MSMILRGIRKNDTADIADLLSSPGVIHGYSVIPYISEYEVEELLRGSGNRYWIIAERAGRAIGFVNLEWGSGRWRTIAKLGLVVGDGHTGQGAGRRLLEAALSVAFLYLSLEKVELVVYVDNPAARSLYESCGFRLEGTKRHNAIRHGIHVDAFQMSILRSDFERLTGQPPRTVLGAVELEGA